MFALGRFNSISFLLLELTAYANNRRAFRHNIYTMTDIFAHHSQPFQSQFPGVCQRIGINKELIIKILFYHICISNNYWNNILKFVFELKRN